MTTAEAAVINEKIKSVYKHMESSVIRAYERWQDEKEYEDINEYAKFLKDTLNQAFPDVEFLKISKKPFGFTFKVKNVSLQISVNRGSYSLKQVK